MLEKNYLGGSECSIQGLGLAIDRSWPIPLGKAVFMDTHIGQCGSSSWKFSSDSFYFFLNSAKNEDQAGGGVI